MKKNKYSKEMDVAKALALKAGSRIMEIYNRDYKTVEKENNQGPVTEADIEANDIILFGLSKEFPLDSICSEEIKDDLTRLEASRVWCIDPIDGTLEFIKKNGEFCVQIALIEDGRPVIGVVYLPVFDRLYFGGPQIGSFKIEHDKMTTLKTGNIADVRSMRVVVSRFHRDTDHEKLVRSMGVKSGDVFGSIGGKISLILEGLADFFVDPKGWTHEWDICAPQAILIGAGGRVTDITGDPLCYNKKDLHNAGGLLASNGTNHEALCEAVKEALRNIRK